MVTLTRDIALPRDTNNVLCHITNLTRGILIFFKKKLKIKI